VSAEIVHNTAAGADHDPVIAWLRSMSGKHIHFFPNPGNAGDGFIAHATYELFSRFGVSYTAYKGSEIAQGDPVVIGGGGNLVEGRYTDVATLVRNHSERQVVLLPHTIVGYADIVAKTADKLTLFIRDPVSHALALANGADPKRTFLSHDLTFFLNRSVLAPFHKLGKGILYALRTDRESSGVLAISPDNIDLSLSWCGDLWSDPLFCKMSTESLASYIAQFESVLTDRLHISILSAMLGKQVTMLPNSYFKNRAVWEHSLQSRFPNLRFVNVLPTNCRNDPSEFPPQLAAERRSHEEALGRETCRREDAERSLEHACQELAEKDQKLAERDQELAEKEKQLLAVIGSRSWRFTTPLRWITTSLRSGWQ
jgi:exopolysaccharide biosynthesis predicted pyruvyltransferase EpsI